MDTGSLAALLRPVFDEQPDLIAMWAFGSVAAGTASDRSDVDLAVLNARPLSLLEQGQITAKCMLALNRDDVDLVDLDSAVPFLQHRILTRGVLLFERDATRRVTFQAQALSRYFDLQPWLERAYAR